MESLQPADPRQVGDYRLLGRLGAGGMGEVFLGVSPGGRQVAVKVIHRALALDGEFRARFRREVAAASKVSGAFTAPVIDADLDSPQPWLVTSYVPGPSLEEAVQERGPLPAASVLELGAGLAEALAAIHDAGLVHRDLKPSNVLLAADGPRVIDFGIARAAAGSEATAITGTGFVIGSPGFMSPEQVISGETGPASDTFSLGAVLYFAATGSGPFGEGAAHALLYRVAHAEPALEAIDDARLRALLAACLAKDPAGRPRPRQILALAGPPDGGYAGPDGAGPGPRTVPAAAALGRAATATATATATAFAPRPPAPGPVPGPSMPPRPAGSAEPTEPAEFTGFTGPGRRRTGLAAAIGAGGLAAAAAVLAVVFALPGSGGHHGAHPGSTAAGLAFAAGKARPFAFDDSAEQVNSLAGSFPHIMRRTADRKALTLREVFDQSGPGTRPVFGTVELRLAYRGLTADCQAAVRGARLRQDLTAAGCTQVVIGMYLPPAGERLGGRYMSMVAIFNLRDNRSAQRVAFAMGPSTVGYDPVTAATSAGGTAGFVLPPAVAPFSRLGDNQDNEAEAKAMGHFLVITWAQGSGPSASADITLADVEYAALAPAEAVLTKRDVNAAVGQ